MSAPAFIGVNTTEQLLDVGGKPKVNVLMSTFNGLHYLDKQIDSIVAQEKVSVHLTVRDDGSTDGTLQFLTDVVSAYVNESFSLTVTSGENIGFLDSFEKLLLTAKSYDYYAFSDQDDVWDSRKLAAAIASIQSYGEKPALYASSVSIVDEQLRPLSKNDFLGLRYSIPAEIIRHRLAGHTMVWNEALQKHIRCFGSMPVWSHDQYVVLACLLVQGTLVFDSMSYVKHRRLDSSLTPGDGSLIKRLRHEWKLITNKDDRINRRFLAKALMNKGGNSLSKEDCEFLQLLDSDNSLSNRKKLLCSPMLHCGLAIGDIEAKLSILFGKF
ncbi:glycosyltransferase [Adlercreutzia sp. ZJ304]|uniref:glycosyltransferase n=1 Tax=Adlercreutzia sp. ZJ304 TaxID=2709791 RepID=UPI0013EC4FE9|nr:glycosyltransferase [Adlercreutzia sp. ZJ304]